MFTDTSFITALVISVVFHGVVLSKYTNLSLFPKDQKTEKFEISYVNSLKQENPKEKINRNPAARKGAVLKMPSLANTAKIALPPSTEKPEILKNSSEVNPNSPYLVKPALARDDITKVIKKITFNPVDIEKNKDPSYLNYYQLVREKIRHAAYQNYTRAEEGEVYLVFTISNEGNLKEIYVVEEKSLARQYLKQIALMSVRDASPFPNFPKELDYPQLSFNVVVSFEVE